MPVMPVYIETILQLALDQRGDPYRYGAEVSINDSNPAMFDCSELVEWACGRCGVFIPDGSWIQESWCRQHGTEFTTINEGIATRGALLFAGNPVHHVAFSLGNGATMEAKGRLYGTNTFSAYNRGWSHAARIPNVSYAAIPPDNPVPMPPHDRWEIVVVGYGPGIVVPGKSTVKGRERTVVIRNLTDGRGQIIGYNGAKLKQETSAADGHSTYTLPQLSKPLTGISFALNDDGSLNKKRIIAIAGADGGCFEADVV